MSNRARYRQGRADALRDFGHIRPAWTYAPTGGLAELPSYSEDPYRQGYLLGMVYAYKAAGQTPIPQPRVRAGQRIFTLAEVVDVLLAEQARQMQELHTLLPTPMTADGLRSTPAYGGGNQTLPGAVLAFAGEA